MNEIMISEEAVKDRLENKILAIVEQVSTLRQETGLSQAEFASTIGMDKGQFSRLMHGASNMTLESVVRMEVALNQDIIVTPDDYAEFLVDNTDRLKDIVLAAIETHREFAWDLPQSYTIGVFSVVANTHLSDSFSMNLLQGSNPVRSQIAYQSQTSTSHVKE
jgi:transcriptional regulator with XRE-family HTH domain